MSKFTFQLRRGTSAQWAASSRVLLQGEPGVDMTTGTTKVGDGVHLWAQLPTTTSRPSLYLRDYVFSGLSTAANRDVFQQAVVDAETAGLALCLDGAVFSQSGEPVRVTADNGIVWATGIDTHKVSHLTRGKGPIRVSGVSCLFEELNLDGENPGLTGFTGQNVAQSAGIFVEPTAHNTVVRGGRAAGFKCGVFATIAPYDLLNDQEMQAAAIPGITDRSLYPDLKNVTVDGLLSEGCWAAYVPQAITRWEAANITGWYQKMPQSGSEAHLVYPTAVGSRYGTDFTMHDCFATGGDERHAFRPRGQRGGRVWNLRATGCPGLIQVLECEDVDLGVGLFSYDDKLSAADGSGSISIDTSSRIRQAPATVVFREGHVAPPGGSIAGVCSDVIVEGINVTDSSVTTNPISTTAMYKVSGTLTRCELRRPELRSTSTGAVPNGIIVTGGAAILIDDPTIRGNVTLGIRVTLPGATIRYTPGKVEGNSKLFQFEDLTGGVKLVNLSSGVRPDLDASIAAFHTGEIVSASTSNVGSRWSNGQNRAHVNGTWAGTPSLGQVSTTAGGLSVSTVAVAADADISAQVMRGTATRAGLGISSIANTDLLALVLTATGVELVKYAGGVTVLATSAALAYPGKAFGELRAIKVGTRIFGMLNGVQVIDFTLTSTDATTYVTANHGLFVNTSGGSLVNFQRITVKPV